MSLAEFEMPPTLDGVHPASLEKLPMVGDIKGALGTIPMGDHGPRQNWRARWRGSRRRIQHEAENGWCIPELSGQGFVAVRQCANELVYDVIVGLQADRAQELRRREAVLVGQQHIEADDRGFRLRDPAHKFRQQSAVPRPRPVARKAFAVDIDDDDLRAWLRWRQEMEDLIKYQLAEFLAKVDRAGAPKKHDGGEPSPAEQHNRQLPRAKYHPANRSTMLAANAVSPEDP